MSGFTFHVSLSGFRCQVSCVTFQLSLMPKATSTDPPPANSPMVHSRMVQRDPKISGEI